MSIQLLSEETINQIAAGEVIENPASVVKELVENAIDAGSSQILVEIKAGGQQLIRVVDDGSGMDKENAVRSLARFATSKIQRAEDLFNLSTMGFRGEALASIAAVSKMTLHTSLGEKGTCIELEAGKIQEVSTSPRTRGTTIEVSSLFYNVPARKKFQKSAPANAAEITRMITQLALAHPRVGFVLIQGGVEVLSVPSPRTGEEPLFVRIGQLLGEEFLKGASEIKIQEDSFKLLGVLGDPMQSRMNRTGQYLFVNSRPVVSPLLSFAIKDGYGTRIEASRHPTYVLHFEIAPDLVDVNVHPQKREVRLQEEKKIRDQVQEAVAKSLQKHERPAWNLGGAPTFSFAPEAFSSFEPAPFQPASLRFKEEALAYDPLLELPAKQEIRAIGLFSPFLFLDGSSLQKEEQLLVVDLVAASERLLFDALLKERSESFRSQNLLFPLTFTLSPLEAALLEAHLEELEKMGISLRLAGKETFIVDALPPFLIEAEIKDLLLLLAQEFSTSQGSHLQERLQKLALACCRFHKARKTLFLLQEALMVFEELMKSSSPYHSPDGKPTILTMSRHEIFELFLSHKKAH